MKKTVLLLNDTTDWYHFGCTATSLALKESILKLGHALTSIPITLTYEIKSAPRTAEDFQDIKSFEDFVVDNPELVESLRSHDILIINGEGTLHGLRQAPLSLLYVAYIAKAFLGKHVEIVNHSVYPQDDLSLDDPSIIDIYRLVYQAIDVVAIREPVSLTLMKQMGINAKASFDCMPIYIKEHYKTRGVKEEKTLLVAGSAAWLHLNIPSIDKGTIEEFEKGLAGFISYLEVMHSSGYKIEFLYGAQDYPSKDDREFIAFLEPRLSFKWTVITATSLDNWFERIERATLLVSGRFHHSIAAACLGTPFIVLNSNTPKIEGLVSALGNRGVINYNDPDIKDKLIAETRIVLEESTRSRSGEDLERLYNLASQNFAGLSEYFHEIPPLEGHTPFFIEGDGNCMYNAIIAATPPEVLITHLGEDKEAWMTNLRKLVAVKVREMLEGPESSTIVANIQATVVQHPEYSGQSDEEAINFYIDTIIATAGSYNWGDHVVLLAITNALSIQIDVHSNSGVVSIGSEFDSVIHLYQHGEAHYDAYLPAAIPVSTSVISDIITDHSPSLLLNTTLQNVVDSAEVQVILGCLAGEIA